MSPQERFVSPQENGHANRFAAGDSDVIVVIGSGAGGGTLANELCRKGAKVVLIEAGQHHQPEDFINDEFDAREQLRTAHEMLVAIGIEAFAERARRNFRRGARRCASGQSRRATI